MRFSRRPVKGTRHLRITERMDEIATSSDQRTVGFLAMTVLIRSFHPHLLPLHGINTYPSKKIVKLKSIFKLWVFYLFVVFRGKRSYSIKMERETGLEPATTSLEGWSSTN
jgi:hypothetical protein